MKNDDILNILRMRIAVYYAGVNAGLWKDINANGAAAMMEYLFTKSGQLAFYQLMMEQMRFIHGSLKGGVYSLFKMPAQIEKEISEYLRKEALDINNLIDNPNQYLTEMDTIPTDYSFVSVNIGAFSILNLDSILRLCASHYLYAFENKIESYPYFE